MGIGPVPGRGKEASYLQWLESKDGPLVRAFGDPHGSLALYRVKGEPITAPQAARR